MLNLRQRFAKRRCDGDGRRRRRNNRFALRIEKLEQRMMLHHAPWHDGGGGGEDDDDGGGDGVTSGDGHLYILDVAIDAGMIETGDVTVLNDDDDSQEAPAWSPDGQAIAYKERFIFEDGEYVFKKMTLDVSGTGLDVEVTVIDKEVLLEPNVNVGNTALTWSPDSKWIGFMGERPTNQGGSWDLFRIRADGTDLTNVTPTDKVHELYPDWNPTWTNDIDGALRVAGDVSAESTGGAPLSYEALDPVLQQAANHWSAAGIEDDHLGHLDVRIADLSGTVLGMANEQSGTIWIDRDAAGYGWSSGDPASGVDLLSVVMHEVGHILGLEHSDDVMAPRLAPDELHVDRGSFAIGPITVLPTGPITRSDYRARLSASQQPVQATDKVLQDAVDLWTPVDDGPVAAVAEASDRLRQADEQADDEDEEERDGLFAQWDEDSADALPVALL